MLKESISYYFLPFL
ncbi:hypothetical protein TFKS16_1541 [Tannerella forsythia KS16]|nr:hypothetical protein TF3313_1598 [Tannerella forsythia 3313]BAR51790.1 hypothetical protein TFKS16_1541 [Tannerella forsythia KS16]